jgi:hypothetical protein
MMKRHGLALFPFLGVLAFACSGGCEQTPSTDGGTSGGDAGPTGPLVVEFLEPTEVTVHYPYNETLQTNNVLLEYSLRVRNREPGKDWQDLHLTVPLPDELKQAVKITGAWYNDVVREITWDLDWLPADQGSVSVNFTIERDPKIFADGSDVLRGTKTIALEAHVSQYDEELSSAKSKAAQLNLPGPVTSEKFSDMYAAVGDSDATYLAARPEAGQHAGQGGVYRIALSDGTVTALLLNEGSFDYRGPLTINGGTVWAVTRQPDNPSLDRLAQVDALAKAPAVILPALPGVVEIRALLATPNALFALVRKDQPAGNFLLKLKPDDGAQEAISAGLGNMKRNTIAINKTHLFLMQEDTPAIIQLDQATLAANKLVDLNSTAGERTLACNDEYCVWTEWNQGGVYRCDLKGDGKTIIASSNQSLVLIDDMIYSGINGMLQVGIERNPPARMMFTGGLPAAFWADKTYLYFGYNNYLWRMER